MYKHLFFDDRYLFSRENAKRVYGQPKLIKDAIYCDQNASTVWPGAWCFKTDDGKYRILYQGLGNTEERRFSLFCAVSDDGINFKEEDLSDRIKIENRFFKNEVMILDGDEVACIVEDRHNLPEERYKMLYTQTNPETLMIEGILYVSADLLNWKKVEGVKWSEDGEPIAGVFYNHKKQCFTILKRPAWGVRMVGFCETKDWKTYTPYVHCIQADSLDGTLEEIYGTPSFEYDGWFIGFPHIYGGFGSFIGAKFKSGTMEAQLAYSHNGSNWFRSLRDPFISERLSSGKAQTDIDMPMVWPCSVKCNDEDIYIYATASLLEHGPSWTAKGLNGRILVYKLRKDGFIKLETEDKTQESVVATRENAWHGGELNINIKAQKATIAVYQSDEVENMGMNFLGVSTLVEGYTHEDCIPFEGNLLNWTPEFKDGKCLDDLKGRVLSFEMKFSDGEIYSISGNMTPLFNVEAERYRQFKMLPDYL